jgi:hypothetical protein
MNVLEFSRTTACELLVKLRVLTAEDVLDCGYLCGSCLAVVRRTDELDSALALNVGRLRRAKERAVGGKLVPFVPTLLGDGAEDESAYEDQELGAASGDTVSLSATSPVISVRANYFPKSFNFCPNGFC